ncbi:MAG: carbon-nitrogen hydrolase family protein [Fimbriimonadales bacterium]
MEAFRVAAVQATPVFMDRVATVDKAIGLIRKAAKEGARLIVFPEAFVPTYPLWSWFLKPSQFDHIESLYSEYLDQSLTIPGPETAALGEVAKELGVFVVTGACERNVESSGGTLFNSLAFIGPDGSVIGKRRKLIATGAERLVWGSGDGSTVGVVETALGRVAGLICWENYMPLARYAMYAGGAEVILAPTWDQGEVWQASMRHIAKEGRAYVVACANVIRREDIPERFGFREFLPEGWLNTGGSAIVDPEGTVIAGPLFREEGILYADLDPAILRGLKWNLDVAGHYARPDVFTFSVDRTPRVP